MRKPDPERIYLARRAATFRRLVDEQRVEELDAEHWIAAWEHEAVPRGLDRHLATFYIDGQQWIAEQLRRN